MGVDSREVTARGEEMEMTGKLTGFTSVTSGLMAASLSLCLA